MMSTEYTRDQMMRTIDSLIKQRDALAAELAAFERYRENLSQAHVDQADRIRELEVALGKIIERADKGRHEEDFDSIRILASHAYAPPQTETSAQRKGKST